MENAKITEMPVREMTEAEKTAHLEIVKESKDIATPKKPKKTKAPKARPVEELVDANVKQMTEKEKDALILFLKEQLTIATNKIEQYKLNAESAFASTRNIEDSFNAMEDYYMNRMNYIRETAKSFYQSVCLATKGDVK